MAITRKGKPSDSAVWAKTMESVFTDKEFIAFADRTVDKIAAALQGKAGQERQRFEAWFRINRLFLWLRFGLSLIVLLLLGGAVWYRLLPTELVAALLTAVVASLFVPPKKDQ